MPRVKKEKPLTAATERGKDAIAPKHNAIVSYFKTKSKSKYGSKSVMVNGIAFDSIRESKRYQQLLLLEKAGEIIGLRLQVPFELVPAQYEKSTEVYTKGAHKGEPKKGACIEKAVVYRADFVYTDKNGNTVVEDTKGFKTKDYIIKRKLMLWLYGIRLKEI